VYLRKWQKLVSKGNEIEHLDKCWMLYHNFPFLCASAYCIMTAVKCLDNTTVLTSVSRNDLMHSVYDRHLRFLGHVLWNTHSLWVCAAYMPVLVHYTIPTNLRSRQETRCGHPRTNYQSVKSHICKALLKQNSQRCLLWIGLHEEPRLKA